MKCFLAYLILTAVALPALAGLIYALFTVPFLARAFGTALSACGVAAAIVWAGATAATCWADRHD
jgi:hypothetical protein